MLNIPLLKGMKKKLIKGLLVINKNYYVRNIQWLSKNLTSYDFDNNSFYL